MGRREERVENNGTMGKEQKTKGRWEERVKKRQRELTGRESCKQWDDGKREWKTMGRREERVKKQRDDGKRES